MIDKNKLRLGNIVNYSVNNIEGGVTIERGAITALTQNKAIVNGKSIKYCNLLPLYFDEKILDSLGFEHDTHLFGDFKYKFRFKDTSISLYTDTKSSDDRIISYYLEENYVNESELLTEIVCNSLHELQNCFFDITKRELVNTNKL